MMCLSRSNTRDNAERISALEGIENFLLNVKEPETVLFLRIHFFVKDFGKKECGTLFLCKEFSNATVSVAQCKKFIIPTFFRKNPFLDSRCVRNYLLISFIFNILHNYSIFLSRTHCS